MTGESKRGTIRSIGPIVAAAVLVVTFHAFGESFFNGWELDLGSTVVPEARHTYFILVFMFVGTLAVAFLGLGILRLVGSSSANIVEHWAEISDRRWIVLMSILSAVIPVGLRYQLLDGAPLFDDESAYRFSAELLASGRLWAESPTLKLFFDRAFMINDGRLYSQYPLGWPALMVPGVWLGNTGLMNPIYSALTIPPLFFVLRRLCGSNWAKVGVLCVPLSPMLMMGAAVEVSHTSCLMALAWMLWFTLRSRDDDAPPWVHAGVAFFFSLAFFIRPSSAVGLGLPLLVVWSFIVRRRRGRELAVALTAFAVPAVVLAGLFLLVNEVQNGSMWTVAYERTLQYAQENDYRFSAWPTGRESNRVLDLTFASPLRGLAVLASAWLRLNADLFGWPLSLFFAILALGLREARLYWGCAASFCLVHFFVTHVGVDTFGPVHFYELALPVLVLTVLGLRRATDVLTDLTPAEKSYRSLPIALLAAGVIVGAACFVPVRFAAIADIADHVNTARDAVERANLHNAVVFSPRPYAPQCSVWTTAHFVFWRPNNDPDLENDILWVNHINVEVDRLLMEHFPNRQGYVAVWTTDCEVAVVNLDNIEPGMVPDGPIGGSGEAPELGIVGGNNEGREPEGRRTR